MVLPPDYPVTATGAGLSYQWYSNTTNSNSGGTSLGAGAQTSTYTPVTTASGTLYYYVIVSGTCAPAVTSNVSGAVIVNNPPTALAGTAIITCSNSGAVNITAGASATNNGGIIWTSNGTGTIGNATSLTNATYTPGAGETGNITLTLTATGNSPCANAVSTKSLTINQEVSITTPPQDATVCASFPASFSVTATGTGLTYQWYLNGNPIPGATSATYNIAQAQSGDAGNYTVMVSGAAPCTSATSSPAALLTVNKTLAITNQPAAQTVCEGSNVTMNVVATGTIYSYQWRKNGNSISDIGEFSGTNTATLTITGALTTDAGSYDVVISSPPGSGSCSQFISNPATITVNTVPSITAQPSATAQSVCLNGTATQLSVTATGADLVYQWYSNSTNSNSGGTSIVSATSSTYTPSTTVAGTLYYYVVVTGICAPNVTSAVSGSVTINTAPSISVQPSTTPQSVCLGGTITQLSVTATGAGLAYQWYSNSTNSNSGGTSIGSATSSTYTPSATVAGTLYYYVVVTGTCASPVTSAVSGSVTINTAPSISVQPSTTPQSVCLGGTITQLSVTATGAGLAYQWYSNSTNSNSGGTSIGSATSSTYTPSATVAGTLYYYVVVTGTCTPPVTSAVSGSVTINTSPSISGQPSTSVQSICLNGTTTPLSVTATGAGLAYQWFSNTTSSNSGGTAVGTNAATYTPATTTAGTLYYYVVVTGSCTPPVTSAVSGAVTINTAPSLTIQPSTSVQSICLNGTATPLSVTATGAGLAYQWFSNTTSSNIGGTAVGTNAATYTPATTTAGTLYYYVVVTGSCTPPVNSAVSGAVTINTAPAITVQPSTAAQSACLNGTATQLSVTATGEGLTYQWYSNSTNSNSGGTAIVTGTSSTYTPSATVAGTLYYYVVVSGTCTPPVTSTVSGSVTISPASVGGTASSSQLVCQGAIPTDITLTGNIGNVIEWQKAGDPNFSTTITHIANTTTTLSGATIGSITSTVYLRAMIQSGSCTSTYSTVVTIALNPPFTPVINVSPGSTFCLGQALTLSTLGYSARDTILGGDFGQANPPGWSGGNANNSSGGTDQAWGEATSNSSLHGSIIYNSISGDKFQVTAGTATGALVTPVFSTIGRTSLDLQWIQGYNFNGAANGTVQITIDGGVTWTTLATYNSSSLPTANNPFSSAADIPLNSYLGQANVQIRFNYTGTTGSAWAVDNVNVVGPYQPITYTWPPGFTVLPGGNSATITPSPAGTYNYTITTGTTCGTTDTTITIVVNPLPTITGTQSVCIGATTQLTGSATAATTNPWVSSSPLIAGIGNSGLVTGLAGGTSTITYTNTNGCSITALVTVNPLPTITVATNTQNVCASSSAQSTTLSYSAVSNTPTTYSISWNASPSNSFVAVTDAPLPLNAISIDVPANTAPGTYTGTITVKNANGCASSSAGATFTVTVDAPAAITAQPAPIAAQCVGSTASISATISGTPQWQVSTDGGTTWANLSNAAPYSIVTTTTLGVTTTTLNITPTTADMGANLYSVIATASSSCVNSVTSNSVALKLHNVWTGATNTEWNTSTNWSDGLIPSTLCPTVVVPVVAINRYPILSTLPVATITNLQIATGASVTITGANTGVKMQIGGTITNGGIFDVTNGTLEMNGTTGTQNIDGNNFANNIPGKNNTVQNLIISNNVNVANTALDTLNITGALSFGTSSAQLATGDNITLKSSATATANVGILAAGNVITGHVTVERYINTGNGGSYHTPAWQFVATPTQGQTVFQSWMEGGATPVGYGTQITAPSPNTGFDGPPSYGPSLKYYDPTHDTWVGIGNPTTTQVYNPNGYMLFVRGDRSIIYPNVGNTTLRTSGKLLTPANPPADITVNGGKYASIGNPYASAVYMSKISAGATLVSDFFYVWDPTLSGSYGVGGYRTLSPDGTHPGLYVPTPSGGGGDYASGTSTIESGQAFFMQAFGSSDGTVSFDESMKASGSNLVFRGAGTSGTIAGPSTQLRANLYGVAGSTSFLADGNLIQYNTIYSDKVDGYDARKLINSSENFGIISGGKNLVIERRTDIQQNDTIFYNLTGMRAQNYKIVFTANGLSAYGLQGFIEDSWLKTRKPLNMEGTTEADFAVTSAAGSYAANRFRIVFAPQPPTEVALTFISLTAQQQDANIAVNWKVQNEKGMKQYEVEKSMDGVNFTKVGTVTALNTGIGSYQWIDTQVTPGDNYYRIRCVAMDGSISYSTVVKVTVAYENPSIAIYPNPITDGIIHLQFVNQPQGRYGIRLLNSLGQLVSAKQIEHPGGDATENIRWNYYLSHGVYQLEVIKPDGSLKVIKVLY